MGTLVPDTEGRGSSTMSVHTINQQAEQVAFSEWINGQFTKDPDVKHLLPLKADGSDMYRKMDDGIIVCKIINLAAPDTIDERAINKLPEGNINFKQPEGKLSIFKQHENLTLALNSASSVGCVVVGMDSHNFNSSQNKPWLVLGLTWQLIRMHLFRQISINEHPGLVNLLMEGETLEDLMKLSPEEILLRWVNYQLEKEGSDRRASNFSGDIKDSEIYTDLLHQIAPKDSGVDKTAMQKTDPLERADIMLKQADKIGCKQFVTPKDVKSGHEKLNLAFVANLFNTHPHLDPPTEEVEIIEETREEKMFRNWMNSLGVKPRVNYIYSDLASGNIIFQLIDFIKKGVVDWKRVVSEDKLKSLGSQKRQFEMLGNCDYVVELAKQLKLSMVGIGGSDLKEGNKKLILAVVWQLMRAYTLSLLAQLGGDGKPIEEKEIIAWTNTKLSDGGKSTQIKNFQDPANKNAMPIIDLIDTCAPGTINYQVVKTGSGLSEEECFSNAKYAVNMARKIGAPVYALPEDISEGNHKMIMTVYASLMLAASIKAE